MNSNPCEKCITYAICKSLLNSNINNELDYYMYGMVKCDIAVGEYSVFKYIHDFLIVQLFELYKKCSLIKDYHAQSHKSYSQFSLNFIRVKTMIETFDLNKLDIINRYLRFIHSQIGLK